MAKQVFKDGEWQEGGAAPELLRDDLRILPGELVTKEIEEDHKIHELDPEHVADTYLFEYMERAEGRDPDEVPRVRDERLSNTWGMPPVGEEVPFSRYNPEQNQKFIDLFRARAASVALGNLLDRLRTGKISENEECVFHIWFPSDNLNHYERRAGNPPGESQRPKYLRGYKLHVDLNNPVPEMMAKAIAENNPELMESLHG